MAAASTVMAVAAVGGLILNAYGSYQSGKRAKKTANMQADIVLEQTEEEIDLLREQGEKLMSTQQAYIGASGVEVSGSPLLVMQETARKLEEDELKIRQEGERTAELIREEGEAAYWQGLTNTASTLLTGGAQLYNAFSGNYSNNRSTPYKYTNRYPTLGHVNLGRPYSGGLP